jgi:type III secretion protein J
MTCRSLCPCIAVLLVLGCSTPIQHGLDETAANEILTSLERASIPASKNRDEDGAFAVSVSRADAVAAMELLRSLGLPRGRRAGFGDVYKQPSLVPTPTEERARYVEALAGEIARTLETVEGVVSARVHLVLPELDPLAADGKPRVPAQAAVLLKTRAGRPLPIAEADVQKLVAGSVPGLEPAAVSVVVTSAAAAPAGRGSGLVALGPLLLTPDSRSSLLAVAVGVLALVVVLAALLLLLARRLAAAQRKG